MNVDEDVCKDSRTHAKTLLMFTVCLAISWELHKVVIILHCLLGFGVWWQHTVCRRICGVTVGGCASSLLVKLVPSTVQAFRLHYIGLDCSPTGNNTG